MPKTRFDVDLERSVLARCLEDPTFLRETVEVAAHHDFSTKPHAWVFAHLSRHYRKRREVMSGRSLVARLRAEIKDSDTRGLHAKAIREIVDTKPVDAGAALDLLRDFVRFQRMHSTTVTVVEKLEKGDLDGAEAEFARQSRERVGRVRYDSLDWYGSFDERVADTLREIKEGKRLRIRTGIRSLDRIILGQHIGELGMILATTGKGKTILLLNFTVAAVLQGFGGIFFALEMPARQIARRLDSRILKVPYTHLRQMKFSHSDWVEIEGMISRRESTFKDKIQIVSVPVSKCTTSLLESIIEERRADGHPVDFVMFDSLDHVKSDVRRRYEQKRHEASDVYWWAKGLAMGSESTPGFASWTTCHAGREWRYRIATPEATSESYDKSRIVDVALSVNQTRAEEKAGILTGYLAKYRDGPSWVRIPMSTNYQLMTYRELRESERAAIMGEDEEEEDTA